MTFQQKEYFRLNTKLSSISDKEFEELLIKAGSSAGWGSSHVLDLDGDRIFVKKIPLTELEFENGFSLDNVFELPQFYNYGLISGGLGAYRELHAHIMATNWTLSGHDVGIPPMYHHRIVHNRAAREAIDEDEHAETLKYWANNKNIDRAIRARAVAEFDLLICSQWLPHCLGYDEWFSENSHRIHDVMADIFKFTSAQRKLGLLHFDTTFQNCLTDGDRFYLTDLGLNLTTYNSKSPCERDFFERNRYYPESCFMASTVWHLSHLFEEKISADARDQILTEMGSKEFDNYAQFRITLLKALPDLEPNLLKLCEPYKSFLLTYRDAIILSCSFVDQMISNDDKDTVFPNDEFAQAMQVAGITLE